MNYVKVALVILFHPIKGFESIKYFRPKINYLPGIIMFLLAIVSRFFYINLTHYPLATIDPWEANLVLEIAILVIPYLTWALAMYLMSAITSGEAFFYEVFNATGYCLLPYILFSFIMPIASQIMTGDQMGLLTSIQTFVMVWVIALLFFSNMTLNDYTFKKTVGISLLSIITMVVIWAIALLVYALSGQIISFVYQIIDEINMMGW